MGDQNRKKHRNHIQKLPSSEQSDLGPWPRFKLGVISGENAPRFWFGSSFARLLLLSLEMGNREPRCLKSTDDNGDDNKLMVLTNSSTRTR